VTSDQQRERSGHKRATHNSTPPDPAPSLPAVPAGAGDNPYERFNVRTSDQSITTNNSATMPKTSGAQHQETLEKLAKTLDDAHAARARLGDPGESNIIGPDDIDKLREPAKRLAAWRRLITDTVESVTVAPAMTADGRPSRLWDPRRIDIRFLGQQP
jgi:hypothetical protein